MWLTAGSPSPFGYFSIPASFALVVTLCFVAFAQRQQLRIWTSVEAPSSRNSILPKCILTGRRGTSPRVTRFTSRIKTWLRLVRFPCSILPLLKKAVLYYKSHEVETPLFPKSESGDVSLEAPGGEAISLCLFSEGDHRHETMTRVGLALGTPNDHFTNNGRHL